MMVGKAAAVVEGLYVISEIGKGMYLWSTAWHVQKRQRQRMAMVMKHVTVVAVVARRIYPDRDDHLEVDDDH